ncbi:type II toxin-antitoxin system PemK/MazF family toxin, partial [Sporosarcina sp. BP05]|uniref:type II toxin-antitoxin system PemK/MazF family toxin n=1 Tax=Sporosarcina sp. BP05 TaxID=2758726 RepID=UPI00164729B8
GRIVNVNYGENVGFEKNLTRPSIIVSVDSSNQSSGNVLVIPMTKKTNKAKGSRPFRLLKSQYLLLKSNYTGLAFDSVVQCEDIRSVSKARLGDLLDTVTEEDMKEIDKRLSYIIGL